MTSTPERVDVSIVTSGHEAADARLHRLTAALVRAGLSVEVLALGHVQDGPAGAVVRTEQRGSMVSRALRALRYAALAEGGVLVALDPDSLLAARLVAALRRRRVVADVHEDYAALLRDRAWARGTAGRVAARLVGVATAAARGSDLTVVADEHVPPRTADHRLVVRNLPDPAMLPAPSVPDESPRAVYIGDVRRSRGLFAMLDAVAAAPGWSLDVVGPVADADWPELLTRLQDGLAERVRFHGRQPPAGAWQVATGAWCGLVLLEDTAAFRDALPSKLYEYLATGLPVVVTDLPRQAALVRESGLGHVVPADQDAGAAAGAVLRAWSADPATLEAVRRRVATWHVEHPGQDPYGEFAARVADLTHR